MKKHRKTILTAAIIVAAVIMAAVFGALGGSSETLSACISAWAIGSILCVNKFVGAK